jgi:translation elongation factor EF-1beta
MRFCERCTKETTWFLSSAKDVSFASRTWYYGGYLCGLCEKDSLGVIVIPTLWKKVPATPVSVESYKPSKYEKVAHYPRPSIKASAAISKALGESADLYRKALICRNQGFGIAALAYIRRVVEDKTNELIEVVENLAVAAGVSKADVEKIRGARVKHTTYDQKLKLASEAIPIALRPDGVNPLGLLYGLVSEGLHGKSEEECLKIADEIGDIFEYVFGQLRAQVEDQKGFVAKVKKWAGGQKRFAPADERDGK